MSEKEKKIVETFGRELPSMTEREKLYLMGFMEGFSAVVGNARLAAEQKGA